MLSTSPELASQPTLQAEIADTAKALLEAHRPDADLATVSAIEYTFADAQDTPALNSVFTLYPKDKSVQYRFAYDGEMHGMYFRFKRGQLQTADRTTNGYQPCDAERETWFRGLLGEVKSQGDSEAKVDIRINTKEPVELRF